ncbi:hypothetical protein B0F90DRAFT_1909447 [Multifurca ochricompacta]|uniref:Magnesium transporter n=1 Tax=Multifurca ochricompacta TaxID=376703 RepID=A0AAD4MDK5_9AGAM|nr:hypothetical protein B0F90DRAFT_1909447 [Multifurca ochricompacta]
MPALSAGDGGISIAAGIIIGLLASFVQSLGLTIQRKSHVLNQSLPDHLQRVEHRRPLWLIGFLIFISSNILGSLFQIASLPVVILAPLGAVSLLWNAFFACFILGDVFSPWMILGTLLIAAGAVLVAIFGIVPEPTHSLEDLLVLFRRPTFVAYFSLLGFAVLVCLAITHITEYSYSRRLLDQPSSQPSSPLLLPIDLSLGLTERTPLLDRKRNLASSAASTISQSSHITQKHVPPSRTPLLLSISYASTSGILSGMCLVFAKSGVELLLLSINGNNQFWKWQAWMLILGLVAFALLQLWYLHKALKLADPTIVCPLAFCFYNLSSIVSLLPTFHLLLVTAGIFILLCGVWVVSLQAVDVGTWHGGDGVDVSLVESGTVDEGSLQVIVERDPTSGSPALDTPERERVRRHTVASESAVSSPPLSPTTSRRRSHHYYPRHHTGQSSLGAVAPVSSPPTSVPAPGFSIGLSPVSPGFALVPRERRRCTSGQSGGDPWDDVVRRVGRDHGEATTGEGEGVIGTTRSAGHVGGGNGYTAFCLASKVDIGGRTYNDASI